LTAVVIGEGGMGKRERDAERTEARRPDGSSGYCARTRHG
jgi:hypothetical protein